MPKINVYLPDDLASAVREAGVPVSVVCQAALADAVQRIGRARQAVGTLRDPATSAEALQRLADGLRPRTTPRLLSALRGAATGDDGRPRATVTSLDLLGGLLDDGENLAVRLLLAQGVDLDALARRARAAGGDEGIPPAPGGSMLSRMTLTARQACAGALEAVVELGHNYLGCEHLLVGLASGGGPAHASLADHGVNPTSLRQAIRGAAAGAVHERSASGAESVAAIAELSRRLGAVERQLAAR